MSKERELLNDAVGRLVAKKIAISPIEVQREIQAMHEAFKNADADQIQDHYRELIALLQS